MIALAVDLLRSRRTLLFGICAGILAVAVGYLALYPSFEEQLQTFADDLPDAYKALLGDIDLATPEGYIRSQVYSLIAPLLIAGAAIAVGSGLARAERDQTLAVLAVTPLPRRSLAGAWWLSIVLVAGAAAITAIVGVAIGAPLAGADVSLGRIVAATLPLFVFGVLVGGVALFVGTLTGAPGSATGTGWLFIVASFVLNSVAELIDSASWLSSISPWSWHGAGAPITERFDSGTFLSLVVSALLVGAAALWRFERRNLHL